MDWINSNSGIIVLIASIILIVLVCLTIWLTYGIKSRIAVQRLNFLGLYTEDTDTHERYASFTIGNKSLNDVSIAEVGLQNGRINFPYTDIVKKDAGVADETRLVAEQRGAVKFRLSEDDLKRAIYERKGKKKLKTLRVYAVDVTGGVYRGRVGAVRKLLAELLAEEKRANKVPLLQRLRFFKRADKTAAEVAEDAHEEHADEVTPPVDILYEAGEPVYEAAETAGASAETIAETSAEVIAETAAAEETPDADEAQTDTNDLKQ